MLDSVILNTYNEKIGTTRSSVSRKYTVKLTSGSRRQGHAILRVKTTIWHFTVQF